LVALYGIYDKFEKDTFTMIESVLLKCLLTLDADGSIEIGNISFNITPLFVGSAPNLFEYES
jgi:hypothetical protein